MPKPQLNSFFSAGMHNRFASSSFIGYELFECINSKGQLYFLNKLTASLICSIVLIPVPIKVIFSLPQSSSTVECLSAWQTPLCYVSSYIVARITGCLYTKQKRTTQCQLFCNNHQLCHILFSQTPTYLLLSGCSSPRDFSW